MKFILAFIFFTTSAFAFENGIDVPPTKEMAKYTAIIHSDLRDNVPVHCTGVLISRKHILSSGYCLIVRKANNLWVTFGVDGNQPIAARTIKNISGYPWAVPNVPIKWSSDLAIAELDSEVPAEFEPVVLNTRNDAELETLLPELFFTGAGGYSSCTFTSCTYRNRLQYVTQQAIPQNFNKTFSQNFGYVFCINNDTLGLSLGTDLGGPVVYEENGKNILAGVMVGSLGYSVPFDPSYEVPGSCENRTSVAPININIEWINSIINP